ncbi:hypothetical protein KXD40_003859 [Peronospora effusa]|uniref:Jacalin-type lectin domain-containing protein n=2 Tax=Peronospora effusa TaxID=542832 RepID=A0A3M6VDZ7_9STRA|nr:hypothetical protein DD238_007803 [Peronospora effusa]UIZ23076.1 hypothetical protein KXD40_003859 [Peronospora effusa]CAI5703178.1 unnamed protein product [Peronospora effusa]
MVLRAVKWAVQAALLLQVLQYSVSVNGIDVNFESLEGEKEERSEDDMEIASSTPGPFNPRMPTASLISGHEDYLTKMGVDISPYTSTGDSKASDPPSASPADKKKNSDTTSKLSDSDDTGNGNTDDPTGGDNGFASLLSGLSDGSKGKTNSDASLLGASGESEGEDNALGNKLGGKGGSGDMPSFSEFFSKMAPSLGSGDMGGLGALFGMVDPTEPQNITVNDGDIIYGKMYGSDEHGDAFSDINNIKFGQAIVNITIRGAARVDSFGVMPMTKETVAVMVHGGTGGGLAFIDPEPGNTIDSVEVHWQKHNGKTCIFYLEVITSDGQTLSAGTKTVNSAIIKPPKDFEIAGFHGRANTAGIYGIGAIFTRVGVKDVAVTDVMAVSDKESRNIYHYKTTIRNWVGPHDEVIGGGCYMKRHNVNSKKMCPSGYRQDGDKCITQCPLNYPIDCYLECIPQNTDCTQAVLGKASSVISVALNFATMGVFGAMLGLYKKANFVVMCVISIVNAIKSLAFYLRYRQYQIAHTDLEKLMDKVFKLQIVMMDLPMALCACTGLKIPEKLMFPSTIVIIVSTVVLMVLLLGEALFKSKDNLLMMLRESGAMNHTVLKRDIVELDDFLHKQKTSCGFEIQTLTNRVIGKVKEIRAATPDADEDDVRVEVSKSPMMTEDVPIITNHCMGEVWKTHTSASAYTTRNLLRKTLNVIIEQLIKDGTTDMAKHVRRKEQAVSISNQGLFFLAMLDPTGIAWMASEFVQPICGPTEFLGEIDDGYLHEALGLETVDMAFEGSYGIWKKEGDGSVIVYFESFDKFDVDVIIYSAGQKINEVKVPSRGKITWTATVKELEDKTLYMDRWRPGLFGLPGSGGGSLLLWVPRTSLGGHLVLHARINVS